MTNLEYILTKFNLAYQDSSVMPIEIPNFGKRQMAKLFNDLDFKFGAEIGVAGGHYSAILAENNPQAIIYGVDPYIRLEGYKDYTKESTFSRLKREAHEKLDKYPKYQFMEMESLDAANLIEDNSLDFVYIDANHDFEHVVEDITAWFPKLKVGGVISGDDYAHQRNNPRTKVIEAVNYYTKENNVRPWFVLGTNAMIPGEVRDPIRSWMWIKE